MTVETTTARVSYNGAGSTGPFSIPFYFLADSHLKLIKTDADDVATTLTLTTHYTLSGADDPDGGSATLVTALATGETLTILRNVPVTQATEYPEGDRLPASELEKSVDKLTMIAQQHAEKFSRAVMAPENESVNMTLPGDRENKYLAFDSDGEPIAAVGGGTTTDAQLVLYTPATPGAPAVHVQSKLRESVSALDDMTSAQKEDVLTRAATLNVVDSINNVLEYAQTRYGKVDCPPILARINSAIIIPSNVELNCAGSDATVFKYYGTGGSAITAVGTSLSPLVRSQIKGLSVFDYGTGATGINLSYFNDSNVEDIRANGFTVGVNGTNFFSTKFKRVVCDSNSQDGFNFTTVDNNDLQLIGCSGLNNGRAGLYTEGGRGVAVLGGAFEGNTSYGVWLSGGATTNPMAWSLLGTYLEGNGTYEVYSDATAPYVPYSTTIKGCYFCCLATKAATAIRIVDGEGFDIDANTFDNISGTAYDYSLYMASAGTKSGIVWGGSNKDKSTNGVYSEISYDDQSRLVDRAFGRFSISGGAIASSRSFNVSSITRIGAGTYEVTLRTALPGTDYTIECSAENAASYTGMLCSPGVPISTTVFRIYTSTDAATLAEARTVNFTVKY